MNQSDYYKITTIRHHLLLALDELNVLDKLPRLSAQIEFMIDGLDEYIKGQKELEGVE